MGRKPKDHDSACAIWDITFYGLKDVEDEPPPVDQMVERLQKIAKKWTFQLEECPTTKRLHYQGRISLHKRKRKPELITLLNLEESGLKGMNVLESSNNSNQIDVFYSLKLDTRLDGPWSDTSWEKPRYIPRQYQGLIDTLYPWQKAVLESRNTFAPRKIDVIIDTAGNSGKSTVASLGRLHYGGLDLPPISDHKELLQMVCDQLMAKDERNPGLVFIDCPRSLDQKKMASYFIAIEQIKKGHVADCRYHYKEWDFDSPRVWVFMNHEPDLRHLSSDRWNLWQINKQMKVLEKFVPVVPES